MLGSPGRLIDLDQEYSAGASARTAAGGTPQVPLAPRLASRAAAEPLSGGGAALRRRGRPGPLSSGGGAARDPSPAPSAAGREGRGGPPAPRGDPRSPLTPRSLPAPRSSPGGGALSARWRFFGTGWGGGGRNCSLFLAKALLKNYSSSLGLYRSLSNFPL